jgi:hypothetical protein
MTNSNLTANANAAPVCDVVRLAATEVLRVWADPMQDEWVPASVAQDARRELVKRDSRLTV